jgi:septum formation protein
LRQIGLDFEVRISLAEDEVSPPEHDPILYSRTLASHKAHDVARDVADGVVVGADTIVVLAGEILNKPSDDADALRMLTFLQGRTHQVITAVAVLEVRDGEVQRRRIQHVTTEVAMRPASEAELLAYIATGEPRDKAGAYAIQGRGSVLISGIVGDYFNVVGLPIFTVAALLSEAGIQTL